MAYTEQELAEGCKKNSRKHQQALYQCYAGKLFALCLRYAGDRMQAEDFLQEGFIRIFSKIEQYKGDGSLEGWMKRIMVNTALQHLRREKSLPKIADIDDAAPVSEHGADALDQMAATELIELIEQLPTGYRMVFNLYVIEEYSHKEIADELGISEGTSKSQLARARNLLQKLLKKNERIQDQQIAG